jgi:hypothetical protein
LIYSSHRLGEITYGLEHADGQLPFDAAFDHANSSHPQLASQNVQFTIYDCMRNILIMANIINVIIER